jgi:hypothetical protein
MKALACPDSTQKEILQHLRITEALLAQAASKVSGRECSAEIVPMPDLGLPHNVRRIHGGFFTGAYYSWETDVPLIPVDATVNLCGVALFRTSLDFRDNDHFQARVAAARAAWEKRTSFAWNYANGNHFLIYGEVERDALLPAGRYLILHASAAEFKTQYNGLYPTAGNWYADNVRVLHGAGGRYLRYLSGKPAERFIQIAGMLTEYQRERQRFCAGLVVGEAYLEEEVISIPHYGMPDQSSVAIGCQWMTAEQPLYLLLTRPWAPMFFIKAAAGGGNEVQTHQGKRILTPHGLGVESSSPPDLRYLNGELQVAGRRFSLTDSLASAEFVSIRDFDRERDVTRVLNACPGEVVGEIRQIYSYYRNGAPR